MYVILRIRNSLLETVYAYRYIGITTSSVFRKGSRDLQGHTGKVSWVVVVGLR